MPDTSLSTGIVTLISNPLGSHFRSTEAFRADDSPASRRVPNPSVFACLAVSSTLSLHNNRTVSIVSSTTMLRQPPIDESAPCLAALVANSCNNRDRLVRDLPETAGSAPDRLILHPS